MSSRAYSLILTRFLAVINLAGNLLLSTLDSNQEHPVPETGDFTNLSSGE
jgi:hypothetical protein